MSISVKNNVIYHNKIMTIPSFKLRSTYKQGKVLVAHYFKLNQYANIIAELDYNKGLDENGNIKPEVFKVHKNHEYSFELSYIQVGVVRPLSRVDIPDVDYYHISGTYGPGVRRDLLDFMDSKLKLQIKSLGTIYKSALNANLDELYIYYSRGEYDSTFHHLYFDFYGTSIGKIDFFDTINGFENLVVEADKVYCIPCSKLLAFLDMDKAYFESSDAWEYLKNAEMVIPRPKDYKAEDKTSVEKLDEGIEDIVGEVTEIELDVFEDEETIATYCNPKLVSDINSVKEKLEDYVSDNDMECIERLITYIYQGGNSDPRSKFKGINNLILYSSEYERIDKVVRVITDYCTSKVAGRYTCIDEYEIDARTNLKDYKIIHISNCEKQPYVDPNAGTGSQKVAQNEIYEKYINRWEDIKTLIKDNVDKIFIFSMEEEVYKDTFCKKKDLLTHLVSNVVRVKPMGLEEVVSKAITEFKTFKGGISDNFNEKLEKYINIAYSRSLTGADQFISELKQKIMTNYYSIPHKDNEPLSAYHIPKLKLKSTDEIMRDINQLHGLKSVKEVFNRICNSKQIESVQGDNKNKTRYHMVFTGNPGTGKTTVARKLADMLYSMGIIKTNNLVEKRPADFISGYSGVTPDVVKSIFVEARDGVLFVDEAYSILNLDDTRRDQVIDCMMKYMDSEPVVMVFAGYEDDINKLLQQNQGIKSRIGYFVHFEDYKKEELYEIFKSKLVTMGYKITKDAISSLEEAVLLNMSDPDFGNARGIEGLCQKIEDEYNNLILSKQKSNDRILDSHIFKKILPPQLETNMSSLVGIEQAKVKLDEFKKLAIYEKNAKQAGLNITPTPKHMIFTGNPGTGKTTVAKVFAQELYNAGVIPTNKTVVVEPKDLSGNSNESGSDVFRRKLREAKGGVFFIDEAYSITNKGTIDGLNIIEHLLTAMLEHKEDIIFIFAGYPNEMNDFMDTNPGLKSRIGTKIHFSDYTPKQLVEIFKRNIEKIGYKYDEEILREVYNIVQYFHGLEDLGNARFVDNLISIIKMKKATNVYNCEAKDDYHEMLMTLSIKDIPSLVDVHNSLPGNDRFASPQNRDESEVEKTVIHELGHALVAYELPATRKPIYLYFVQNYMSYGRVLLERRGFRSKPEFEGEISVALAGRNAEIMLYGYNSCGCSGDYNKAKHMAEDMVREFAMSDEFVVGETDISKKMEEILSNASKVADEILYKYKPFIVDLKNKIMADELDCMRDFTIKGEDFAKLVEKFKADNKM